MKDRLQELMQKAKELEESKEKEDPREEAIDIQQQAVVFEREPVIESYLHEIRKLQNAITDLSENVVKFGQQQKVLISSMRRFSVLKKESDVTKDIKVQAESIKKRLDTLSLDIQKAETETGSSSSLTRILKNHHAALFRSFQSVMFRYNEAIMVKQAKCKTFIVRQLEVAGKDISEEEVNNMVDQGKWDVFNENLLTDVKITKGKLNEIEQRHKELISLENQIRDLRDIFLEIYVLVDEQGEALNNIEMATKGTEEYVQRTNEKFKLAVKYKKKNPCKTLFCCCCPCC
ncbi:syntaxin-19 [Hyla sarda]|uniref:syntaxin-19 n=1 Tax=Hyla sarda TaxID=327740 RepID=UPI0024C38C32|nr:syntaxin-19 [Hyla sarda]XP_056415317.1 syntaxin-19 [Hyla sarda]